MFEYYIIIIFLNRRATLTIHAIVMARNNSATKLVKKFAVPPGSVTKKAVLCERGLQQNLNSISGYDMALIRADNRDSRRLTVLR